MKLPASLGQKKTKAIEQMLEEVGVGKALLVTCCILVVLQMCKNIADQIICSHFSYVDN